MNWKVIIYCSLFGLAIAFATISFIPENVEPILWLFSYLGISYATAKHVGSRFFLHGFMVGLLCTLYTTAIHVGFLDTYLASHPMLTDQMPKGVGMRTAFAAMSIVIGMVSSLILGAMCYAAAKIAKKV